MVENELITKVRIRNVKSILSNVFQSSGGSGGVSTASNGLTKTGNDVTWEGPLTKNTLISGATGSYGIKLGDDASGDRLSYLSGITNEDINLLSYAGSVYIAALGVGASIYLNNGYAAITGKPTLLSSITTTSSFDTDQILVRKGIGGDVEAIAPSGGGTSNFLRADGTWATPSGGGGGTVTSVTSANADITVATTTTTPVLTMVQAPALRSATTTVNVSSATAPTSGQVLTATSGTTATWQTPASATGAWLLASGGTATGTNTFAMGSNPFILTSGVTTGTGATAGIQNVFNSLTTGNGRDISSSSATTGFIDKITSTSTVINHTVGTHGLSGIQSSGANSTSAKSVVGQNISVTNTGTTSINVGQVISVSGATNNTAAWFKSGTVGIGSTYSTTISDATVKLDVKDSNVDAISFKVTNDNASGTNKYMGFSVLGATGYGVTDLQNKSLIEGATGAGTIYSSYGGPAYYATGTSRLTRMKIDNSTGDFSIGGTTMASYTAAAKVEIRGNGTTTGYNFITGDSGGTLRLGVKDNGEASIVGKLILGSTTITAGSVLADFQSTTLGVVFPRMTTTQKNAVATPVAGMVIYDTTLNKLCVYTTVWETITSL